MHHPNEQVMKDIDDAQLRGDFVAFASHFTEDMVAHIPGKSSLAGDYKGRDQFMATFQKFSEMIPEYTFKPHSYLADDEHGVALQYSTYKKGDTIIEANDAFVVHFRDGKVSELWFFGDKESEVDALLG
jgi:uncharacterized protein